MITHTSSLVIPYAIFTKTSKYLVLYYSVLSLSLHTLAQHMHFYYIKTSPYFPCTIFVITLWAGGHIIPFWLDTELMKEAMRNRLKQGEQLKSFISMV